MRAYIRACVSLTEPLAAVELHPHADVHGVVADGHEAHGTRNDGRLQVLQHNVVGVAVSLDYLLSQNAKTRTFEPGLLPSAFIIVTHTIGMVLICIAIIIVNIIIFLFISSGQCTWSTATAAPLVSAEIRGHGVER